MGCEEKNITAVKAVILAEVIDAIFLITEKIAMNAGLADMDSKWMLLMDTLFRVVFGTVALVVLAKACQENLKEVFTNRIPKIIWIILIPIYVFFLSYFLEIPLIERVTFKALPLFGIAALEQLATGFYEETVSRGIVMSAFRGLYDETKTRLIAVILSGILFGLSHFANILFGGTISDALVDTFTTACWGMFIAAIYMVSENLLLVMTIHAAWDIVVRIPNYFFMYSDKTSVISEIGQTLRDVIDPFVLGIMAITICFVAVRKNDKL